MTSSIGCSYHFSKLQAKNIEKAFFWDLQIHTSPICRSHNALKYATKCLFAPFIVRQTICFAACARFKRKTLLSISIYMSLCINECMYDKYALTH